VVKKFIQKAGDKRGVRDGAIAEGTRTQRGVRGGRGMCCGKEDGEEQE